MARRPVVGRRGGFAAAVASWAVAGLLLAGAPATQASAAPSKPVKPVKADTTTTEPVVFVGSNWEGTVQVIEPGTWENRGTVNVIPDIDERMQEMLTDPERMGYFVGIRMLIGEGNDQYVDDMYSTNDGRLLIASRPSLRDVVAIGMHPGAATFGQVVWRFVVDGQRSDHMAISPDGRYVAVSASTGNVVHILDVATGNEVGRFPSGDSPHENVYSHDGQRIYHASIGLVYTPADQPQLDTTKGDRHFQVVDATTNQIIKQIDIGQKLEEAGYPNMSSAVRPMAHTKDERFFYFQISFFHGFVEYDLVKDRVTRVASLPNFVPDMPREQYLLDSAHHGIAMNGADTKLCVAGTMSDYAAIVSRATFDHKIVRDAEPDNPNNPPETEAGQGGKPYWATTSKDGRSCYISWSGLDHISVVDYETEQETAFIKVGNHPQRIREGFVPAGWTAPTPTP